MILAGIVISEIFNNEATELNKRRRRREMNRKTSVKWEKTTETISQHLQL